MKYRVRRNISYFLTIFLSCIQRATRIRCCDGPTIVPASSRIAQSLLLLLSGWMGTRSLEGFLPKKLTAPSIGVWPNGTIVNPLQVSGKHARFHSVPADTHRWEQGEFRGNTRRVMRPNLHRGRVIHSQWIVISLSHADRTPSRKRGNFITTDGHRGGTRCSMASCCCGLC